MLLIVMNLASNIFKLCELRCSKPLAHETISNDLGGDDDQLNLVIERLR